MQRVAVIRRLKISAVTIKLYIGLEFKTFIGIPQSAYLETTSRREMCKMQCNGLPKENKIRNLIALAVHSKFLAPEFPEQNEI